MECERVKPKKVRQEGFRPPVPRPIESRVIGGFDVVPAGRVIENVCVKHSYTRSHVARLLREYKKEIGARKIDARWYIRASGASAAEKKLAAVVLRESGKRRKSGEGG